VAFGRVLTPAEYDPPGAGKDRYQRVSERIMAAISALTEPRAPVI
jgi:1-acyl-sn-glycerol-3-phosphate acyltransferase